MPNIPRRSKHLKPAFYRKVQAAKAKSTALKDARRIARNAISSSPEGVALQEATAEFVAAKQSRDRKAIDKAKEKMDKAGVRFRAKFNGLQPPAKNPPASPVPPAVEEGQDGRKL